LDLGAGPEDPGVDGEACGVHGAGAVDYLAGLVDEEEVARAHFGECDCQGAR
jgi:hypothetical protein